nr:PHP domain-containing protein [Tissierella simiarum]
MRNVIFDLHVHTNHSDGILSPERVVDLAVSKGLNGIAITDHDTITGIEIGINHSLKYKNFKVIPGIEFSSVFMNEEVHILGYFVNYDLSDIIDITDKLRSSRITRGLEIVEKINNLGMDLTIEEVKAFSGEDYIGRPHIARALIKKGYVLTIKEAFEKYLDRGKSAYVERYKIAIEDTIDLIKKSGGISVLAHPGLLKNKDIIKYCISKGINGLECIHSKHKKEDVLYLLKVAKDNNLIITGGSDCHGDIIHGDTLLGKYYVNLDDIPQMKGRI